MARKKNEESSGKFGTFLIILIFLLIWITALALLVKLDVGGIGTTLRPYLKDVPVISLMLPNVPDEQIQWEENYPYKNMDEAMSEIDVLRKQVERLEKENTEYAFENAQLKAENLRLKTFEDDVAEFEERVKRFEQYVVFNDKAPDVEAYKEFYESIEPENAERLYQYVVELIKYDEGVVTQAELFANMKPGQAAEALQEMTADIGFITKVLLAMKQDNATEIMNKMDALFVARVMQRMTDINNEKLQSLYEVLNTEYPE